MFTLLFIAHAFAAPRPFDCEDALGRLLTRAQPTATLSRVAAARALGVSWTTAVEHDPPNRPAPETLDQIFAEPEFKFWGGMNEPFGARVLALPIALTHPNPLHPAGPDARVFALYLKAAEIDRTLGGRLPAVDSDVPEAFAHLRYYRRGHDFVITDLRSDLFLNLPVARRERYRGWATTLLLAFERFAAELTPDPHWRVILVDPDYAVAHGAAAATARRDLRDVALRLGYHRTVVTHAPDPDHDGHPRPIGPALAIALGNEMGSRAVRGHIRTNLNQMSRDRLEFARAHLRKQMPARAGKLNATPAPRGFAAEVKFTPLSADLLYADREQRDAHARALATATPWARDFPKANARRTLISLARAEPYEIIEAPATLSAKPVTFEHWPNQERHAAVRRPDEPGAVTIKGVGRRTLSSAQRALSPQVFAPYDDDRGTGVWGGLTESEGIAEFRRHLRLLALGRRAGVTPSIAIPIDVGWPEQWPRVDGDERSVERTLVGFDHYLESELAHAPERLVQARFWARASGRVSSVAHALSARAHVELLDGLLRETYAAFDETLITPDEPVNPPATTGRADHATALGHLARVAAVNGAGPQRILREWTERTLRTIGLLHGAGGHFGGTHTFLVPTGARRALGAPRGGATAKRNITLAGELRDLDHHVHLPGDLAHVGPEVVDDLQREDLRVWMEAHYWMSVLVFGRAAAPADVDLPFDILGDPNSGSLPVYRATGDAREDFVRGEVEYALVLDTGSPGAVTFRSKAMRDVYEWARDAGAKAQGIKSANREANPAE